MWLFFMDGEKIYLVVLTLTFIKASLHALILLWTFERAGDYIYKNVI